MSDSRPSPAASPRFFYGWVIVAGGFATLLLAYGSHWSAGIFFEQLRQVFGADRAVISGAYSVYIFLYPIINLGSGRLVDRYDPRWILGAGGVSLGLGLALMSQVTAIWQIYALYATLIALGLGTSFVPTTTVVVKWFVRRRGLAAGLVTAGVGLGTVVVPPISGALIAAVGWRGAYLWLGSGIGVLLVLTALVMVREPELKGLQPDGAPRPSLAAGRPSAPAAGEFSWTVGEALRTTAFWLLTTTYLFHSTVIFVPLVHLVGFSYGGLTGMMPVLVGNFFGRRHAGAIGGVFFATLGCAAGLGPFLAGALADVAGSYRLAFAVSALANLIGFFTFLTVRRPDPGRLPRFARATEDARPAA